MNKRPTALVAPATSLLILSFFAADIQAGIGPFLGVYLLQQGWGSDRIGTVMSIAAVVCIAATAPAGAFVDATKRKRAIVVAAGLLTLFACVLLWFRTALWAVTLAQIATAVSGAVLGPALVGLTLGLVKRRDFDAQFGRNQVANHAGNLVAAALCGWLGWRFGLHAIFIFGGTFGLLSAGSVLLIPRSAIDHRRARGLPESRGQNAHDHSFKAAKAIRVLTECRPLILVGVTLAFFNLGNSAMLPLYGMFAVTAQHVDASAFTAETIVVSQLVMIVAAWAAYRLIKQWGYWPLILVSLLTLPLRGIGAAIITHPWGLWPIQALDGIGSGLQSVVVPAIVVKLLEGTGRVNVGQGAMITIQAIGAAMSPAIGGTLAMHLGYPIAFFILSSFSVVPVALWIWQKDRIKGAAAGAQSELTRGNGTLARASHRRESL